jgi:hypothetical protein
MDDTEYNRGIHQQHVLKITKGEYRIIIFKIRPVGDRRLENVVKKCCVKEKSFLIMQAYMYNNSVICVFK